MKLPDTAITVVHRSDGSGTTYHSPTTSPKSAPNGAKVGGQQVGLMADGRRRQGQQGVAALTQRIRRDRLRRIAYASRTRSPTRSSRIATAPSSILGRERAGADKAATGRTRRILRGPHRPTGQTAWPIAGASFVLMHRQQKPNGRHRSRCALYFFDWGYNNGR